MTCHACVAIPVALRVALPPCGDLEAQQVGEEISVRDLLLGDDVQAAVRDLRGLREAEMLEVPPGLLDRQPSASLAKERGIDRERAPFDVDIEELDAGGGFQQTRPNGLRWTG